MAATAPLTSPVLATRLRLKRRFLQTLIVSLTVSALTAVAALLIGEFNETTARILATLLTLAFHSGVAMACAHALERQRRPRHSAAGLVLFAASFVLVITCTWWPSGLDEPFAKAVLTTLALLVAYILSLPAADAAERRRNRTLATAGLVLCGAAFLMTCVCIWAEPTDDLTFLKATAILGIAAFTVAHSLLLLRVPGGGRLDDLCKATMIFAVLLAAMASASILGEYEDDYWYRVLGAVGVLDATGSLTLLIAARLRQVRGIEGLQTTAAELELRCPRCLAAQTVAAGASRCTACGLKFRIEIEEPRCPECEYVLWKLPERRCPECGTPF